MTGSAITRQQCRFLATWTAWQLLKLFGSRETVDLRLFVHDLRLRLAFTRIAHGRFARCVVAVRTTIATTTTTTTAVTALLATATIA
ncbi:hypothetical protein D3C75_1082770 [compost metagenome]